MAEAGGPSPRLLDERYRLLERLGAGGMGEVWLGEHLALKKRVAVKLLSGELAHDETFLKRFEQEAISASRIGHENIVAVTDFGRTSSGEAYLVMELLEGEDLLQLMRREGPLPAPVAVPLLKQVCRALGAAHAHGIVHRDLKPSNVMVTPGAKVKVLDFGISKVSAPGGDSSLTERGTLLGTPAYMSPEQAMGESVDARSDIYSWGVLAYHLVTGSAPFGGDSTLAVLIQHQQAPVEPPRRRSPTAQIPPRLDALILKALAKDPAQRPRSMEAVEQALLAVDQPLPRARSPFVALAVSVACAGAAVAWVVLGAPARVAPAPPVAPAAKEPPPPALAEVAPAPPPAPLAAADAGPRRAVRKARSAAKGVPEAEEFELIDDLKPAIREGR